MAEVPYLGAGPDGHSHIGKGSRITGEMFFPGTVELPGYVNGRVDASAIVIEETGEVEGEIHAETVTIKGRFKGKVMGGTVQLHAGARVTGDITYTSLSIESGAELNGACVPRSPGQPAKPKDQASRSSLT